MTTKNGNWTIMGSKKIFENDFFKVRTDDVIQPDRKDGTYTTIKFREGVAVLAVDDEGSLYLTKQFRYALERNDLEIVAGIIEDEPPVDAAKREISEELGIEAEEWIELGRIEGNTSITVSTTYLFLARHLTFHQPNREDTEDIETVKMKLDDALEKVMNGEITHDLTIISILKAARHLSDK